MDCGGLKGRVSRAGGYTPLWGGGEGHDFWCFPAENKQNRTQNANVRRTTSWLICRPEALSEGFNSQAEESGHLILCNFGS